MSKVPALAQVFRNMGYSWSVADELCNSIEALGLNGARSDDVAAALLRWKAEAVTGALEGARRRAGRVLKGNGTGETMLPTFDASTVIKDVAGQGHLFDTVDERNRLQAALAPQREGR